MTDHARTGGANSRRLNRWFLLPVLVLLGLAVVTQARGAEKSAAPLRILCVGDSITAGFLDTPQELPFQFGYRGKLYALLTAQGISLQFVGAMSNTVDGTKINSGHTPSPDLRALGQDRHYGYAGRGTAYILNNIEGWLVKEEPDVILLMIGLNDIWHIPPATLNSNLNSIVQKIVATAPNADLIVAQITPMASYVADIVQYNTYIRDTLVPSFVAQHKRVSTVDQYANFLTPKGEIDASLFSNGNQHPSATAYDRMARTWLGGIMAVRPVPKPGVEGQNK